MRIPSVLRAALAACVLTSLGFVAGGCPGGSSGDSGSSSDTVDSTGGTVTFGQTEVIIPAGAFTNATLVTIAPSTDLSSTDHVVVGQAFSVTTTDLTVSSPISSTASPVTGPTIQVQLPFTQGTVSPTTPISSLVVLVQQEGSTSLLEVVPIAIDVINSLVTVEVAIEVGKVSVFQVQRLDPVPSAGVLEITLADAQVGENGGQTTGTVKRTGGAQGQLSAQLTSADPDSATTPGSVTLFAGQTTAQFLVDAVVDVLFDGDKTFSISASATGFTGDSANITVLDENVLPIDQDVVITTDEDITVPGTLTAQIAVPLDPVRFEIVSGPTFVSGSNQNLGQLVLTGDNADGAQDGIVQGSLADSTATFEYTPGADFNGEIMFEYQTVHTAEGVDHDSQNITDPQIPTATITITVNAVNDAPRPVADTGLSTDEDTAKNFAVLTNDIDVDDVVGDGDPNGIEASTLMLVDGANRTTTLDTGTAVVTVNNGTLDYTPRANVNVTTNGVDSFEYTVMDTVGAESVATTVEVTINDVNDAPTANNDTPSTNEDTPVAINVVSNDADNDLGNEGTIKADSIAAVAQPSNGTLSAANTPGDGQFTYTPNADFSGQDSFTYQVMDDDLATSNTATVTIDVSAVNDPPREGIDANTSVDFALTVDELQPEDTDPAVRNQVIANTDLAYFDIEQTAATALTYTLTAAPSNGTLKNNGAALAVSGTFTQDNVNNSLLTYEHNESETPTDSFSFTIDDGQQTNSSASRSFALSITPTNDNPIAVAVPGENQAPNFTVGELATLAVSDSTLSFRDDDNTDAQIVYTLTSTPTNGEFQLNGVALNIGNTFTQAQLVSGNVLGYENTTPNVTTDSFDFSVADTSGGTGGSHAFSVAISDIQQEPVVGGSLAFTVDEEGTFTITLAQLTATDADSGDGQIRFELTSVPAAGEIQKSNVGLIVGGSFTKQDIVSGLVKFVHDGSETPDSLSFAVNVDDDGEIIVDDSATINITITPVNDAPVLTGVTDIAFDEDGSDNTLDLDDFYTDAETAAVDATFTVVGTPSAFTVDIHPTTHVLTVTGKADTNTGSGSESLQIMVTDTGDGTDLVTKTSTDTLAVTIDPINDAPTIASISNVTVNEDSGADSVSVTGVDAGPNEGTQVVTVSASSDDPTVVAISSVTGSGATRSINFTTVTDGFGTATITVTAVDDGGTSGGGQNTMAPAVTFTITVNSDNDAPTLAISGDRDVQSGGGNRTKSVTNITAGPRETQGFTLAASDNSSAFSVSINPTSGSSTNGSASTATVTITPTGGLTAKATGTVTVTVTDGDGIPTQAQFTVNVFPTSPYLVTPTIDTSIYSSNNSLSAARGPLFAGNIDLNANSGSDGSFRRALMEFDVADLPANAIVSQVQLDLEVTQVPPTPPANPSFTLHRLVQSWGSDEVTGSLAGGKGSPAAAGDATFDRSFFPGTFWSTPGGTVAAGTSGTLAMGPLGSYQFDSNDAGSAGMITDVETWAADSANNHGWQLRGQEGVLKSVRKFDSRSELKPPTLRVFYTVP